MQNCRQFIELYYTLSLFCLFLLTTADMLFSPAHTSHFSNTAGWQTLSHYAWKCCKKSEKGEGRSRKKVENIFPLVQNCSVCTSALHTTCNWRATPQVATSPCEKWRVTVLFQRHLLCSALQGEAKLKFIQFYVY